MRLVSRRSRFWRSIIVGSTCFALGSLALVRADTIPLGRINALADQSDSTLTAHVNAAGELSAIDQGTRAKLDRLIADLGILNFDSSGNLRVATQGTNQITGHVSVDNFPVTQEVAGVVAVSNFPAVQDVAVTNLPSTQNVSGTVTVANLPATQNVNITGGTISTTPKLSDQGSCWGFQGGGCDGGEVILDDTGNHGGGGTGSGTCMPTDPHTGAGVPLNITGYTMKEHGGKLTVTLSNSSGNFHWVIHLNNSEATQTFPFPLKADRCTYVCESDSCYVSSSIVGFSP